MVADRQIGGAFVRLSVGEPDTIVLAHVRRIVIIEQRRSPRAHSKPSLEIASAARIARQTHHLSLASARTPAGPTEEAPANESCRRTMSPAAMAAERPISCQ